MKRSLARGCRLVALSLATTVTTTSAWAVPTSIVAGFDYFQTVQPTFFTPLGALNPLAGVPIGPGATDTIVQRQTDCAIDFNTINSQCTIPIEMLALSLVSTVNPLVLIRESPTLPSTGLMTITSDGSGGAGTFSSFFDVFVEISLDGGSIWQQQSPERLESNNTPWHMNGDDFIVPFVSESGLRAQHTGIAVPEPGSLALLGLALVGVAASRRRGER